MKVSYRSKILIATIIFAGFMCNTFAQKNNTFLSVPGYNKKASIDTAGISVLPSGRYVTPAGKTIKITHDPFGLAVSSNGNVSITLHDGIFTVIDNKTLNAVRIPDYNKKIPSPLKNGSFIGLALDSTKNIVYLSGGDEGSVIVYDYKNFITLDSISLNGVFNNITYNDSFTSDLLILNDELLVLDRGNFRLVRINIKNKKIIASIPTGRQPFGLALSPDKKSALVANVGMYAYPLVDGTTLENYNQQMIPYHPYANNTDESINGKVIDGKKIPGLGSPNAPESMSVYLINLDSNKTTSIFKTGLLLGEMIDGAEVVGGASPNSIVVGNKFAYVTNATNDNISVIDYKKGIIVKHIPIKVDRRIDKLRGLLPFGIEMSKDEQTLYVALLGFNAVAVINLKTDETIGLIPTGWGPTRVKLAKDGQELFVISCRGYGAGPNGGKDFKAPVQGTYVGDIQLATFQKITIPNKKELAVYTKQAIDNTFITIDAAQYESSILPISPNANASPIKHIVFITKENRTFDELLGQLPNVNGDPTIARFGNGVDILTKKDTLRNVNITPNHTKIANAFACSDNFYCDSDASIHGHHWMLGVIPNEWVETNSSVSKTAKLASNASGRRFPGSTGSMDPEDYAEIGGLWEALERKNISFYNFGQANETAHVREDWYDTTTGAAHIVMVPMQKAVWSKTSHNFAGYNTNIPDQYRMNQFEEEFSNKWLTGKEDLPSLLTVMLPNDHTSSPRPEDGYPFQHSFVADNDLALGRMMHFLSRTPYWKDMLVIVTEDDPQGGVDHVDAHRSIFMLAGPYVRKGYVSHTHANFGSILKMMYNILGVPYVNQYDVTASLVSDMFTTTPDFNPYDFEFPDKRVFDWDLAMKKYNKTLDWKKIKEGPKMDDSEEIRKNHYNENK